MPVGLVVKVGADLTGFTGAIQAAAGGSASLGDALRTTVAGMGPQGAAIAAVTTAVVDMTKAAAEDRAEQEKLLTAYSNLGIGLDAANAATQAAIDLGADKAFSDSEVRDGLAGLITATGNADEANALLAKSMDIARAAGVPLEQAADAVAKAHAGQDAALRKLFPGMEKQASAADTITAATKLSTGAADDYAKSTEGMQKKGSDAFGELGELVGQVFLPIMDELLPAIGPVVELLGELLNVVLPPLVVAVKLVAAALRIMVDVLKTVVEWVKKAMDFIADLAAKIQSVLPDLSGLGNIDLNPFAVGGGGAAAMGRSGRSGRSAGGGGTVVVNVYGGDPRHVVAAVREGYRRWTLTAGKSAPDRDW